MSDSKPSTFKLDDDKDVHGRLCALSWFDGVRGEYELLVNVGENDARDLVAKLTAWLDAPRMAAREPISSCSLIDVDYQTGVAFIKSTAGEWGVIDSDGLSHAPGWLDGSGLLHDWYATEAEARAAYRNETSRVTCESCTRFIDRDDAMFDRDGIYTCADEAACSAACAAKGG